ncbi:MAG: DUF3727 domain-containing protein, partial [Oscillatoriales cyanobacterium SM2_1_8]|nr:DUF3727 domain-containing protein [Oscillatoriales cyanobacterium SM2_1_8]
VRNFCCCIPLAYPGAHFAWESETETESTLVEIEDSELAEIYETAKAVLAEKELTLQDTAYTLTVAGELPEEMDEEDIVQIDVEGEDETEDFLEIAKFYFAERGYSVFLELDPLPFFAKRTAEGEVHLLDEEAIAAMQPQLEEHFAEYFADEFGDEDEEE